MEGLVAAEVLCTGSESGPETKIPTVSGRVNAHQGRREDETYLRHRTRPSARTFPLQICPDDCPLHIWFDIAESVDLSPP